MRLELPIVSFISAFLVLIPLPLHWRKRNLCMISMITWLAVCNTSRGINSIIWADNVTVKYKIWCDIVTRISLGGSFGVLGSAACVCRRLAQACSPYYMAPSWREKRKRAKFEIGVCVVFPILYPVLHIAVESHRFGIIEEFGCVSMAHEFLPSLLIIQVPMVLFTSIALVYAGIALRWLIHRRVQFLQTSQHTQLIPPSGPYLRLVMLATTQMGFATVMTMFMLGIGIHSGFEPWTSWGEIHRNWREVLIWPNTPVPEIFWTLHRVIWYFMPISSVMVFANFGFDDRVSAEYRRMFVWVKECAFGITAKEFVILPLRVNHAIITQNGQEIENAAADEVRTDGLPCLNPPLHDECQVSYVTSQAQTMLVL